MLKKELASRRARLGDSKVEMSDLTVAMIGLIGANLALIGVYVGYILPETEKCVITRKSENDSKLRAKLEESQKQTPEKRFSDIVKDVLLYNDELSKIKKWENVSSQLKNYITTSIVLSIIGIFVDLSFASLELIKDFYFAQVFLLASAIYFGYSLYFALNHRVEIQHWKLSPKN